MCEIRQLAHVFTGTSGLDPQMVAGVADSGDCRLALNPVSAQAFATAQVVNRFVVGATVTSGCSGYVSSPAVTIVGGGGTNAAAIFHIADGVVTSITITNAGIGYTNAPTVRIAPPPAAALSPTVSPVMRVDSANLAPYDNYQIQFKSHLSRVLENAPEIVVQFLPECGIAQEGLAVFGGENGMHQDPGERLPHGGEDGPAEAVMQLLQSCGIVRRAHPG